MNGWQLVKRIRMLNFASVPVMHICLLSVLFHSLQPTKTEKKLSQYQTLQLNFM